MGGRRLPTPCLGWDQQAGHPRKSRKLLGTWDWTWRRWRPEGTETVVQEEMVQGQFEERDKKKTAPNVGEQISCGLGREEAHGRVQEEWPRER